MPGSEKEYRYWGKFASTFDDDTRYIVGPTVYQEVKRWLVNQFKDMDTVLELGCGTGFFSEMIADKVKHLVATDLAQEMVDRAREKLAGYSNVEVQLEDCYDTSFGEGTFDATLLVNLIHIVKDPIAVLKESHRVLKGGGTIVIVDATGYGMTFRKKIGMGIRYMKRFRKPTPYGRNLSPDGLAGIVRQAGFVVEESKLIGKDTKAVCLRGKKLR